MRRDEPKPETSTNRVLSSGLMIGLGILVSKYFATLQLASQPVEAACGWFLVAIACYLLPGNRRSISFPKWAALSVAIAVIAFLINLLFGRM
jgi:hypothetical protein